MLIGKVPKLFKCARPNSTFRFIDDTFKTNVIRSVGNQVQIRNNITNLFTAVEFCPTNHCIWNIRLEQGFLNGTRLSIGTVKNSEVFEILDFFTDDIIDC